jgi:hypothetical protein
VSCYPPPLKNGGQLGEDLSQKSFKLPRVQRVTCKYTGSHLRRPHDMHTSMCRCMRTIVIAHRGISFCVRARTLTLKRLSCSTFLMATVSPVSWIFASNTTPKDPFPMTLSVDSLSVNPCIEVAWKVRGQFDCQVIWIGSL